VGELLNRRRIETTNRIKQIRETLADAEKLCGLTACVYSTGSFSRGEASSHSDLDLFIVSRSSDDRPGLRRLDEILIKADLIETTRKLKIPDFSGDGEYLTHYTVAQLTGTLGKPEDDVSNTFTARLLLLLESLPLLGNTAYQDIIEDVITAYWRDYEDHKTDFMPAFLANDILRMWRTFCVNYEARTQNTPPERRAARRLMNYKLKHSRLLTCYSALLYLLVVYVKNGTVSPTDAKHMISLTPTQRLEWLSVLPHLNSTRPVIEKLITFYEQFLQLTDASKNDLVALFGDKERSKQYLESAYTFGDLVFEILQSIGQNNRFYRLLVV
jgi:predicted nucleotidyltransferase